jgi:hypothetical protein
MGIEGQEPGGTEPEPTEQKTDIDGLVSMLEDAGVTTPAELEGKLAASQQVGNLAYQLGETRKELDQIKNRPVQPPPTDPNRFEIDSSQPLNLDTALEGAVEKVLSKREKLAAEAQNRQRLVWAKIQSQPHYKKVKDLFHDKLQNPEIISAIQSGETDVLNEYKNTVIDFQNRLLQTTVGAIKAWKTGDGPQAATPHIESGDARVSPQTPEAKAENQKTIDGFKVKVDEGKLLREDEEMAALDAILGP